MSRTYKDRTEGKGPGYEYPWSRRPTNSTIPGRFAKKSTHKKERQMTTQEIIEETKRIHEALWEEEP